MKLIRHISRDFLVANFTVEISKICSGNLAYVKMDHKRGRAIMHLFPFALLDIGVRIFRINFHTHPSDAASSRHNTFIKSVSVQDNHSIRGSSGD